jgi:hypothetical protein
MSREHSAIAGLFWAIIFTAIGSAIAVAVVELARWLGFVPFAVGFIFGGSGTFAVIELIRKLRSYRLHSDPTKLARTGP